MFSILHRIGLRAGSGGGVLPDTLPGSLCVEGGGGVNPVKFLGFCAPAGGAGAGEPWEWDDASAMQWDDNSEILTDA